MKQVAEYISASREQATGAVAPLVDDGYVERYILPDNRLHIHLRLAQAGQDRFSAFASGFCNRIDEKLNNRLSAEDLADLHGAVKTIVRILGSLSCNSLSKRKKHDPYLSVEVISFMAD